MPAMGIIEAASEATVALAAEARGTAEEEAFRVAADRLVAAARREAGKSGASADG